MNGNLFFAIYLTDVASDAVKEAQKELVGRLTPLEKCHLTLCFMYTQRFPYSNEKEFANKLSLPTFKKFVITLDKLELWGNVAVMTPSLRIPELEEIRDVLEETLKSLGVRYDERWTPHLTLARHTNRPDCPVNPIEFTACRLHLIHSQYGIYNTIRVWEFKH